MSSLAPAVGSCVKVIEVLADSAMPIGISEISRRTEINKNMVSRILHTLEEKNWVKCDDKSCYSLTLLPFCLTSKVVSRTTLADVSIPLVQQFWKEFGESTYLGILHNDEVLYLMHWDSIQKVRVAGAIGGSYPLYCTGPGKVLLAFGGEAYIQKYLATHPLKKYTENTITQSGELIEELKKIRDCGYSLDKEEFGKGIVCISAPIFDYTKNVVGVIGCSCSTVYCNANEMFDRYGKRLLQIAQQISSSMGYVIV